MATAKLKQRETHTSGGPMAVLFPGENAWELWRGRAGEPLDLHHRFESSDLAAFQAVSRKDTSAARRVVGLPVHSVVALPMWVTVPGESENEIRQAAELQLERAGLRARNESQGVDFSLIEKENSRSLILAQGLTDHTPTLAEQSQLATDHIAAPFLLPLPPNHLTIWRELGRLVAAITRQGRVVFFDALSAPELDTTAIQEIHRMAAQLSLLDMLNTVEGIMLWTPEGDAQSIADATGLGVDRADRPGPVFAENLSSQLEPRSARIARQRTQQRDRSQKTLKMIGVGAGAVALVISAVLVWLNWQRNVLRNEVASLRPQAAQVEAMRERWASVAAAVDKDGFVLETLLVIQSLPAAESVSLDKFDRRADRISIEGTAPSATQALRFLDALSGSDAFADYDWTFPQPTFHGGSASEAKFEIEGTREEGSQP